MVLIQTSSLCLSIGDSRNVTQDSVPFSSRQTNNFYFEGLVYLGKVQGMNGISRLWYTEHNNVYLVECIQDPKYMKETCELYSLGKIMHIFESFVNTGCLPSHAPAPEKWGPPALEFKIACVCGINCRREATIRTWPRSWPDWNCHFLCFSLKSPDCIKWGWTF